MTTIIQVFFLMIAMVVDWLVVIIISSIGIQECVHIFHSGRSFVGLCIHTIPRSPIPDWLWRNNQIEIEINCLYIDN